MAFRILYPDIVILKVSTMNVAKTEAIKVDVEGGLDNLMQGHEKDEAEDEIELEAKDGRSSVANEMFVPLAVALMFGLIVATILTLVVIPVLFTVLIKK